MSVFKFKQFEVDQSGCAMKINTDGVLLAAMVAGQNPQRILDIGTGTGVIALMLAQRFEGATIIGVEIDDAASATAGRNFINSPFHRRLGLENVAIEKYSSTELFDLMVSNPPFFVNDLKNPEEKKGIARHTDEGFFSALMGKVAELLSPDGSFWFVLPLKQAESLIEKATAYQMSASQQIFLHSDERKPSFRVIVCLKRGNYQCQLDNFSIYKSEKVHTEEYKSLLKDFFLAF